jgi:ubiquinone/menaquinone biosynthesis C-methylase UbiE
LRRGIPFPSDIFDCVYHSHFLEHVDPDAVPTLLRECGRVLKPGGILRIVVPDLHVLVQKYQATFEAADRSGSAADIQAHLDSIRAIFDQMVRQRSTGASQQTRVIGSIEARLRGGAASTGEQHRWMYNQISLAHILTTQGFRDIQVFDPRTSHVAGWSSFQLDVTPTGDVHKRNSLYIEARK